MEKDSLAQTSILPFADLKVGCFYAAKVESDLKWERVQLLGPSAVDADCFRVYCVDIGSFGVVRKHNIRRLKLPLGLRKILLLKCKVGFPIFNIFEFSFFFLIVYAHKFS